jgi:GNAT superfamily N-acetyltransferase
MTQPSPQTLSAGTVHQQIDEVLEETNLLLKDSRGLVFSRVTNWSNVLKNDAGLDSPLYFGMFVKTLSNSDAKKRMISFYIGYSTWSGRCLFVDQLADDSADEKLFLQILAKIAIRLGSQRLTWKRTDTPGWYTRCSHNPPEILNELLVLRMDSSAMESYAGQGLPTKPIDKKCFDRSLVESQVKECLATRSSFNSKFQLRLVAANNQDDANDMARLVHGLAVYTNEPPEAVRCTAQDYLLDGRGSNPLYYCFLMDYCDNETNQTSTCGIAVVYFGYYLKEGRFLYLEDLFVEEAYRKQGAGSLALQSLTEIGLRLQCDSFYWLALEWNQPALDLYNKIGAEVQPGLLIHRYTDEKLTEFANDFDSSIMG